MKKVPYVSVHRPVIQNVLKQYLCVQAGDSCGQGRYIFRLSVCLVLVNAIPQECREGISSKLAQKSTLILG